MTAYFYGIGVGPGDPELLTLKAVRLIEAADIVCYLKTSTGQSLARDIAKQWISTQKEYPIHMPPMKIEREKINQAYDHAAKEISLLLDQGKTIAFLCEGDPFFFGSYIYLYQRLHIKYNCKTISGISSIHASSALSGVPLMQQDDNLAVLSSRNTDEEITQALQQFSSIVIMKAGRHRTRLIRLIKKVNRTQDTCYIERAGQAGEYSEHNINRLVNETGNYFSLFLITQHTKSYYISQANMEVGL